MPIFTFECEQCGEFEVIEPSPTAFKERTGIDLYSSSSIVQCPTCEKDSCKSEYIAQSNFVFKGTGWHCTDYS